MTSSWKGGNKTVIVCRWHDSVRRKSYRFCQKTAQSNKWIWQNSRIQSQHSEIWGIFVYQQWNIRSRNQVKIPFDIATRKIKYLVIKLTQEVKDLYSENNTTMKKGIKKHTNNLKHVPCSWIDRINVIKMSILPKTIYRLNVIPIKVPIAYSTDIEQTLKKLIWIHK